MKKILLYILFFCFLKSYSQGEANIWYFGDYAGLDFNSGNPLSISGSKLTTREGCSSFSDANGNLLFYSDGTTVWNKNHNPMPNGTFLKGGSSSSQSAMIIPKPASTTEFYIFTVGSFANENPGFNYYTIDMTKDGGFGDVVRGPVDLNEGRELEWTEKVAAINGKDCETFWVISYVGDEFKAYKITKNGVAFRPITTKTGYYAQDKRGYLKISPNGKKIAIAHMKDQKLFLYDFNNQTGLVTNPQELNLSYPAHSPYGLEFSSSGEKLYVHASNDYYSEDFSEWNNPANHYSTLYQFNLKQPTTALINSSRVILDSQNLYRGALQLGPDKKIYRALAHTYNKGSNYLGVIEFPENDGLNCNYIHNAIDLGPNKSTQGLPPFIASIFYQIEILNASKDNEVVTNQTIKLCTGTDYTFNTETLPGNAVYSWKLNDSIFSTNASINLKNIQKTNAGKYQLKASLVDRCGKSIIYEGNFEVEVYDPPIVPENLIFDQCDFDSNSLDGITLFNLETKISEITNNNPKLIVTFYKSIIDFENDMPIENPSEYASYTNQNFIVKITDTLSECSSIGKMELNVYPTSLDTYDAIYTCENELNSDSKYSQPTNLGSFNLEIKREQIEELFSNYNIVVEFYENILDTQLQTNKIDGVKEYPNREIFVRISNKDNNNCISAGKFNLVVNKIPLPNFVDEDVVLCIGTIEDNPLNEYYVDLDGSTYFENDQYQWYFNNQPIYGATNPIYAATKGGNYSVEVQRKYSNDLNKNDDTSYCIGYSKFKVVESNAPVLYNENVEIIDDSSNNSITINTDNLGIGSYQYSIDDFYGEYQDEPFFENVSSGFHTIYVKDKIGCGFDQLEVSVIGFPKYFTPNNDGINDFWRIPGVNSSFYPSSNIHIFDRFGTLIITLNPNDAGWNGTLNGKQLPSSDYWYSVELTDQFGKRRFKKGHFSLIRR